MAPSILISISPSSTRTLAVREAKRGGTEYLLVSQATQKALPTRRVGTSATPKCRAGREGRVGRGGGRGWRWGGGGPGLRGGGAMHTNTGGLVEPLPRLPVEVGEVVEGAAREEVALDVLEGVFDLALALLVPRRQGY